MNYFSSALVCAYARSTNNNDDNDRSTNNDDNNNNRSTNNDDNNNNRSTAPGQCHQAEILILTDILIWNIYIVHRTPK